MDSTTIEDTLVYDQLNRLISINPGAMGKYYYYDGEGKRIRKDFSNIHYVYLYDQWGNLIGEVDTSGNFVCDYIWANGKLVAKVYPKGGFEPTGGGDMVIEGGEPPPVPLDSELVFYYHLDHLGTPLALTAMNQDKYWFADYLPFGEIYNELIAGPSNDVRFPGQYHDRETGLYYNWHRYYKPTLGRYYQADPIGLLGGINVYSYVENNPVNYEDPLGLSPSFGQCLAECTAEQFGIRTLVGLGAGVSGLPVIPKRFVLKGATGGTSVASWGLSKLLPLKLPVRIPAPTLRYITSSSKILGRVLGRWIPIVGWGLVAYDAISIGICVNDCMKEKCEK